MNNMLFIGNQSAFVMDMSLAGNWKKKEEDFLNKSGLYNVHIT